MIEEFEPTQYDPCIAQISFAQENGQFSIEIQAVGKQQAIKLEEDILSARRIYDMAPPKNVEFPIKQNFEVECIEEQAKVKISGNIFNAFKLLTERKLVNSSLAETILASSKTKAFIDSTKNFVFSSPILDEEEQEEIEATLQQDYLVALRRLGPEQLQKALDELSSGLTSEDRSVEIKIQEGPRSKSPAVH